MRSVFLITAFIIPVVLPHIFPEKFHRCHLKDADLDNCLKTTIQNALRLIGTSGIASLNLPSIEPLEAIKVEIGAGTSAVQLVQKYENIKMYGYGNSTVEKAHLDLDKKVLTFTVYMPKFVQVAKYDVNGKILMLPMYGSGDSIITLFGATIESIIHFEEEVRKGKTYFKIISYETKMSIKDAHFDLQNLFNGDKHLADNILKVMNENGVVLFDDDKEGIQTAYAEIYKNFAEKLFHNVPVDEIFLP